MGKNMTPPPPGWMTIADLANKYKRHPEQIRYLVRKHHFQKLKIGHWVYTKEDDIKSLFLDPAKKTNLIALKQACALLGVPYHGIGTSIVAKKITTVKDGKYCMVDLEVFHQEVLALGMKCRKDLYNDPIPVSQAAKMLGIEAKLLARLVYERRVPAIKPQGKWLVVVSRVEEALKRRSEYHEKRA